MRGPGSWAEARVSSQQLVFRVCGYPPSSYIFQGQGLLPLLLPPLSYVYMDGGFRTLCVFPTQGPVTGECCCQPQASVSLPPTFLVMPSCPIRGQKTVFQFRWPLRPCPLPCLPGGTHRFLSQLQALLPVILHTATVSQVSACPEAAPQEGHEGAGERGGE